MENCVAPGLDEFDVLLEVVLSLLRVHLDMSKFYQVLSEIDTYGPFTSPHW